MSRSPLAYPLTRGIDGDSGGAADLQTDIMRFMAILGLCLVAIFALVQSLPIALESPANTAATPAPKPVPVADVTAQETQPVVKEDPPAPVSIAVVASPQLDRPAAEKPSTQQVLLQRPKWVPKYAAKNLASTPTVTARMPNTPTVAEAASPSVAEVVNLPAEPPATPEPNGFTLRFESDIALTRLVAAGQVGFYAIQPGRAQRMAVSDSRISFWGASAPNAFHQMDSTTVPQAVVDALARAGADPSSVEWGVTLPAKLSVQLRQLMSEHSGGALVIASDGNLNLERS